MRGTISSWVLALCCCSIALGGDITRHSNVKTHVDVHVSYEEPQNGWESLCLNRSSISVRQEMTDVDPRDSLEVKHERRGF